MSTMIRIKIDGATVVADAAAGTLQVEDHESGQRLGVNYRADTTAAQIEQRARRAAVEAEAGGEAGWLWLDHTGCRARLS